MNVSAFLLHSPFKVVEIHVWSQFKKCLSLSQPRLVSRGRYSVLPKAVGDHVFERGDYNGLITGECKADQPLSIGATIKQLPGNCLDAIGREPRVMITAPQPSDTLFSNETDFAQATVQDFVIWSKQVKVARHKSALRLDCYCTAAYQNGGKASNLLVGIACTCKHFQNLQVGFGESHDGERSATARRRNSLNCAVILPGLNCCPQRVPAECSGILRG